MTGGGVRMFRNPAGRVSKLRRELCENGRRFIGELADASVASVATV
jgi:hypothetical protein